MLYFDSLLTPDADVDAICAPIKQFEQRRSFCLMLVQMASVASWHCTHGFTAGLRSDPSCNVRLLQSDSSSSRSESKASVADGDSASDTRPQAVPLISKILLPSLHFLASGSGKLPL
jgi:hypothetical protein